MKTIALLFFISFILFFCSVTTGNATDLNYAGMKLIGEIKIVLSNQNFDKATHLAIDSVAVSLKKMPKNTLVRIEAFGAGGKDSGEFVNKSLQLAESVERYLRTRHNLDLDYYLSVLGEEANGSKQSLVRIYSLPSGFFDK